MGATFKLSGSGTGAVKAVQDLQKALDKTEKSADGAATGSAKLEKQAKRLAEQVNPQDRYNRKMNELATLVNKGKLSLADAEKLAVKYGRTLNRTGQEGRQAFGSGFAGSLKSTLLGFASISTAIAAIRAEYAKVKELENKRTDAQLTVAQADQKLRQNIFNESPEVRNRLLNSAYATAKNRGLPAAAILNATRSTFSGTGDAQLTEQLVDIATQFTRDTEEITKIAGGLGDVAFTSGNKDVKQALGFLAITQANARLTDPGKTGEEVGKVLASFTAETTGSTAGQGGAILAALSKGIADPTGQLSRTASVNLIDRANKFFTAGGGSGKFSADQVDTFDEQLQLLLSDKELGRSFVGEASFRAASKGGIAKFILGDKDVRGAYDKAIVDLNSPSRLSAAATEALKFVNEGEGQRVARTEGGIDAIAESFRLRPGANLSQEAENKIYELTSAANSATLTGERLRGLAIGGNTFSRQQALSFAESRLSSARLFAEVNARDDQFRASQGLAAIDRSENNLATQKLQEMVDLLRENLRKPTTARQE